MLIIAFISIHQSTLSVYFSVRVPLVQFPNACCRRRQEPQEELVTDWLKTRTYVPHSDSR